MADEPQDGALKTVPIPGGVYRPVPEAAVPERGATGYTWDRAVGLGQGAIDVLAAPAAVGRDLAYDPDYRAAAQTVQEIAADTKRKMSTGKTEYGQAQEEGKVPADTSVFGTLIDSLPATAAIIGSGPFAPVTGGVIAHGVMGTEMWDRLRRMPQDEISKFPKYQELRAQGLSDIDAKKQMYGDRNTLESLALNVGSNAVFAGLAQKAVGGFAPGLRGEAQSMTRSIMNNVVFGGAEGAVAGAALGGGSEAGRQAGEVGAGLRKDYDWGRIYDATVPTAENLALLGGVAGGAKGFLPAAKVRPGLEKTVEKTGAVAENTGYTPSSDDLGSDLMVVAGENLGGARPKPRGNITDITDITDTTAKPPGVPGAPVEPAAARAPGAPAPSPPVVPVEPGARAAAPAPAVEPRAVTPVEAGRPAEGVPPAPVVPAEARPVPPEEAKPASAAAPVEPARQPMSVEELKAQMRDLEQTPTYGALAKLIKQWQDDNPGQKLSDRNGILQEHKALLGQAAQQLKAVKAQAAADEKAAKEAKAAEAKAAPAAPAEGAGAPAAPAARAAPPTISEKIQQRVAERQLQAAREALGEHDAAVDRRHGADTVGASLEKRTPEHIAEGDRLLQQVKDLEAKAKAETKAPVAGAKTAEAIAGAAAKQKERVDLAALQTKEAIDKRDKTDVATNQQYERREGQKSKREQAAIKVFGDKAAAIDELKPLHDRIQKVPPSQAKPDLQIAQRHIQGIVDSYNAELRAAGLPKLGGKFPDVIKTRAGHGPHHNVMTTLNNLARTLRQTIDTNGTRAKEAALRGLELTRRVREGEIEKVEAERAKAAEAETVRRGTKTLGENIENIKDEDESGDIAWAEKWLADQHKTPAQLKAERAAQKVAEDASYRAFKGTTDTVADKSEREGSVDIWSYKEVSKGIWKPTRNGTVLGDSRGFDQPYKAEAEARDYARRANQGMETEQARFRDPSDTIADKSEREEGAPVKRSTDWKAIYKRLGVKPVDKAKIIDGVEHVPGQPKDDYVDGVRHRSQIDRVRELKKAAADEAAWEDVRVLSPDEFAKVGEKMGEKIERTTIGKMMDPFRPKDPIMGAVFDAVRNMVKDMPATTWSANMHAAYHAQEKPGSMSRAFYSPEVGGVFIRPDTKVARTVFHEALHAATSRALDGSERLTHLVTRLQDIIAARFKDSPASRESLWYGKLIKDGKKRVDPHEFVSELFTRDDARQEIQRFRLNPDEFAQLQRDGYVPDKGRSILRTLWDEFLKAIGIVPHLQGLVSTHELQQTNMMKIVIDMLQDTFEREGSLRERDVDLGITSIGRYFEMADIQNLAKDDPVGGGGAYNAALRGDHGPMANLLMDRAERMDGPTADKAIKYLADVNDSYYEHPPGTHAEMEVTPPGSPEQVRGGMEKFLGDRLGTKAADYGYQMDKLFATPMRHFVSGMRYTNDLGNNLEQAFRRAIQPLKDAWSRREHFAQEYMEKSGANKLIDDLATLKHAIKDRGLWNDFEQLLIRESYTRAFADEELGTGRNAHIDTGSLRDMQTVNDHKANQKLYAEIMARDPGGRLRDMRNRIHDFEARDLEVRKRAQASDMLHRMGIVQHGDGVALSALLKDVRNQASTMSDAERKAFARVTGEDHESKQFKEYMVNRKVIRGMLDQTEKQGPHVPFMRHGNHVVTAKYHVTPDAGVKYVEMNPGADLHKGFDFANEADARDFVKNVLSRKDIQITQTGGSHVVYDLRTGEQAKNFTVEKPDGTAKTFDNRHDAEMAAEEGDVVNEKNVRPEEVEQMKENNLPTDHLQIYHRIQFNPQEYIRFESERAADEYRQKINHDAQDPNFRIDVANVETPRDIAQRGVADHASSEMKQWVNRVEASPAYQKMSPEMQEEWKRELRNEAARVTMMTGRRSMFLPREYAKGASTDILKNMIQSSGASARAIAGNVFNPKIADARARAQQYVNTYRNQSGGFGKDHRARQDVLDEFDRRLHAPVKVEGSWALGIKRALQVSMISHLADVGYLVINAMEPWVLGAAISASRHGWGASYLELARANALVNPLRMAREAGAEIAASWRGEYRPAQYENILLDGVKGETDAVGLQGMLKHMFSRGLAARDSGMEVERIHDPSSNIIGRGLDWLDGTFRGANTGVETQNRASTAIMNYRLEMRKALKEGLSQEAAHEQAIRYAEDQVFKSAGDYGSWNNPRYFSNPLMKLAGQFKKYPLRIASVYADAIIQSFKGNREAQKQVAYMLATQGLVSGLAGLPAGPFAGTVNAAYILGLSDSNWDDMMFGLRKAMVDHGMNTSLADLAMHGALDFTGANFSPKLAQSSMLFQGSPDTRNLTTLAGTLGVTAMGAPGDMAKKYIGGIQQMGQAVSSYRAGAHSEATQHGVQAADGLLQIKFIHDIAKAFQLMTAGPTGMPKGNEGHTGQAIAQVLGFTPTQVARKYEEKGIIKRAQKTESAAHTNLVNKWVQAPNTTEQSAIWAHIQKDYNPTVPPEQRIDYATLWKAKTRQAQAGKKDQTKLGVNLSGRQKSFADIGRYFNVGN